MESHKGTSTPFDASKALEIAIEEEYVDPDVDEEMRKILLSQKSIKKEKNPNTVPKNIIFTPKSTLKITVPETEDPSKLSSREIFQKERNEKREMWKLREDLKKVIKPEKF